nr:radical SAM protein [Desulfurispira natronophila]
MQGCSWHCVYCNQQVITGAGVIPPSAVESYVRGFSPRTEPTLAYYGGSFTALPHDLMAQYLHVANKLYCAGVIAGLRISTRPDALQGEVLAMLAHSCLQTLEIGVQSTDTAVLRRSGRPEVGVQQLQATMDQLRSYPWRTVLQVMPGLPGEDYGSFRRTIRDVCQLAPWGVRLYPTVVLRQTSLDTMYQQGHYKPLGLDEAVERCAWACDELADAGVSVQRLGLQDSESLRSDIVAGPWHPAFGELVQSRRWLLQLQPFRSRVELIRVHPGVHSQLVGQRRCNLHQLQLKKSQVHSDYTLPSGEALVLLEGGEAVSLRLART